ncbi:MAG: hypothetical protein C4537_03810 [Acholeplasma sp.]|jgi:uncharacterized protein YdeI (YjbR/CyaY-like superfamily)|nr:MAG: hypothetical protein C4537_03810 [Acholeplasma sp.]
MEPILFLDQKALHDWLCDHHENHPGIWIQFDKKKATSSLTAEQALDEALCFGWIDGQIKRIDDQFYMKYFAKRTRKSIWSTKNKKSIERLILKGEIMPSGLLAVQSAKSDGRWDKADLDPMDYSIEVFIQRISYDALALKNYLQMSPSIQKTYAISYFVVKKEETKQKKLLYIIDRLRQNLKPM